jgi:hypothetical protein
MNNLENNKLIALFMGVTPRLISPDVYGYSDSPFISIIEGNPEKVMEGIAKYVKYDTDLNWLIEVAEKIEKIGYKIHMPLLSNYGYIVKAEGYSAVNNHVEVAYIRNIKNKYATNPPTAKNPAYVDEFTNHKEALYNLVLRFIKWYNENNK